MIDTPSPHALIISDLHLSREQPETYRLFLAFLREQARYAEALFILGDFVEYWIGDDDLTPFHQDLIQRLKTLSDQGVKLYFMAGNRDLLIGQRFAQMTGITILPDPYLIDLYGHRVLLMHGDRLCTQDQAYMRYRRWVHKPWLQFLFLHLPLAWRQKIVRKLRAQSQRAQQGPSKPYHDVAPEAVELALSKSQCDVLIHGHTHRMGIHDYGEQQRVVLSDWHTTGSFIRISPEGWSLKLWPEPPLEHLNQQLLHNQ